MKNCTHRCCRESLLSEASCAMYYIIVFMRSVFPLNTKVTGSFVLQRLSVLSEQQVNKSAVHIIVEDFSQLRNVNSYILKLLEETFHGTRLCSWGVASYCCFQRRHTRVRLIDKVKTYLVCFYCKANRADSNLFLYSRIQTLQVESM